MSDWAREYFERGYGQRWGLKAPSDQVRLEADGLCRLLHLSSTSRVIDVACGHGRHAVSLAARGLDVVGLDFAVALLNRARNIATDLGAPVRLVRGDMRQLPFRAGCADAVIVMDAFGFFETDGEHDAILREATRVLASGGRLGLKMVNGNFVLDGFRENEQEERDGAVISVSRTLTHGPTRMTERISVRGPRGHGEYERHQRLYQVEELAADIERVGVTVVGVFAAPDGTPFDPTASSTMWIVGEV